MKNKLTRIPAHYRQLDDNETIAKGDLFKSKIGKIGRVKWSIGKTPTDGYLNSYTFWRRRHVKLVAPSKKQKKTTNPETLPLVQFFYPWSKQPGNSLLRAVRVVGANDKYIVGLEVTDEKTPKYKFKRFLRNRATNFSLVEFNALSAEVKK